MAHALSIIHILGLMIAVTGSLGGMMLLIAATPAQQKKGGPVRGAGPLFARMAIFGLILLWPSGFVMAVTLPGITFSSMFWMKLGFAALLTFTAIGIEMVYERARRGAPKVAQLLLSLGPLAVLCHGLVAVFSVLAFR